MKTFMAIDDPRQENRPIENPFGAMYEAPASGTSPSAKRDSLVVRTRKGERSMEFEIPSGGAGQGDFEIPAEADSGDSRMGGRAPASEGYASRQPSVADKEILWKIPEAPAEQAAARREIESELGVREMASKDSGPSRSYLGRLDQVKQLYRQSRFEASLLEVEEMLQDYPMDARLHEMRGTLLDRLGHDDLAVQSWKQALEIQPSNEPLRRYLEMKGARAPASAPGGVNR
jgi:hypothetical protein